MRIVTEVDYIEKMLVRTMKNRSLATVLFKKLFLELPEQIVSIESAINEQQIEQAQKEVHKLQGSFSFCGFSELEKQAKKLENNLLANNRQSIMEDLKGLIQQVNSLIKLELAILKKLED